MRRSIGTNRAARRRTDRARPAPSPRNARRPLRTRRSRLDRVAHVLLLEAQRLPAGDAVVAGAARIAEPRHRNPVAEGDLGHAGPSSVTIPTPSWPGTNGGDGVTGQSPWAAW